MPLAGSAVREGSKFRMPGTSNRDRQLRNYEVARPSVVNPRIVDLAVVPERRFAVA